MTDTTPDAAERLARRLLWAFGDSPLAAEAAALIRAQAAEIARHPAALQEARNAALREAANIVRGEVYLKHYRTWVIWPPYDDLTRERPNVSENHGKARHCDQLADAILTLIDTPALPTPAEPAGDALREALVRDLNALRAAASRGQVISREIFQMTDPMMDRLSRAALAAAPAPIQPAPQPDADEREAMVGTIRQGALDWLKGVTDDRSEWQAIADALLADGWTRKREEG